MSGTSKSVNNLNNSDNTNSLTSMGIDGLAGYAKFKAVISVFITFFIFCITSRLGYYIYKKEDIYENNLTKGRVQDSTCTKYSSNNNNWDCSMNLLYNINNNDYVKNNYHINSSTYYAPNTQIDLRYNKYDNRDITTDTFTNHFKGGLVIFIGFFIFMMSLIYLYTVFTWKIVAVASGAGDLAGSIASSISRGINPGYNSGYNNDFNIRL